MAKHDLALDAKIAAERKGISVEQASMEIEELQKKCITNWSFDLAMRNYMENTSSEKTGGPHGVDPIDPIHHTKE
jgi:hypothetical protein